MTKRESSHKHKRRNQEEERRDGKLMDKVNVIRQVGRPYINWWETRNGEVTDTTKLLGS